MSKFKVGDRVRLVVGPYCNVLVDHVGEVVRTRPSSIYGVDLLTVTGIDTDAFSDRFELVEEAKPVRPEPQVPGIPEGYRLVRVGAPKKGERYLTSNSTVSQAECDWCTANIPIVEPINPPEPVKPKTRVVKLVEYVVWDEAGEEVVVESSYDPSKETDTHLNQWKYAYPTGNTREIEVPLE